MKNIIIVTAALLGLLGQAGCGLLVKHEESTLPFGSSVKLAMQQQIYNPEAGGDAPVVGQDGRYAATVAKKYQEGPQTKAETGQSVSEIIIGTK